MLGDAGLATWTSDTGCVRMRYGNISFLNMSILRHHEHFWPHISDVDSIPRHENARYHKSALRLHKEAEAVKKQGGFEGIFNRKLEGMELHIATCLKAVY